MLHIYGVDRENGGSVLLRSVGKFLQDCTASYDNKWYSSLNVAFEFHKQLTCHFLTMYSFLVAFVTPIKNPSVRPYIRKNSKTVKTHFHEIG
jgi:hypothetical protein